MCASLLKHHLNWNLVGYYNQESLWISDEAVNKKKDIIWVDLNILPKEGKAIGGHIVSVDGYIPKGFERLFGGISEDQFRVDISSTELRNKDGGIS